MLQNLTDNDFHLTLYKNPKLAVVQFYATWCGPCQQAGIKLERMAKQYNDDVLFFKVDNDVNIKISGQAKIENLPTILLIKNSKIVDTLYGNAPDFEERLHTKIKQHQ